MIAADLQALLQSAEASAMYKLMNQHIVSAGDGRATLTCMPEPKFENLMGRMHGGFVASLIDSTLGVAILTKVEPGLAFGTIDLNVKFVRAIERTTGLLTAKANVLHAGRTMLTAMAEVADASGKLYAHGSGTFLVYPKQ
jgi:acyl-CoA thioesterase